MSKKNGRPPMSVPEPQMIALGEINEAAYNPRVMPREMLAALKASLRKHGMVVNLVVQRKGMILVGGHQRLRAMREIATEDGHESPARVPCVVMDLSDAEAKQLNVALNNVEGEFDPYKLGELFASIREDLTLEDIAATGFTVDEIDQAVSLTLSVEEQIGALEDDIGDGDLGAFAKSITLTVEFESVEQRDVAKAMLREASERAGEKVGKLLVRALKGLQLAKKPSPKVDPRKRRRAA